MLFSFCLFNAARARYIHTEASINFVCDSRTRVNISGKGVAIVFHSLRNFRFPQAGKWETGLFGRMFGARIASLFDTALRLLAHTINKTGGRSNFTGSRDWEYRRCSVFHRRYQLSAAVVLYSVGLVSLNYDCNDRLVLRELVSMDFCLFYAVEPRTRQNRHLAAAGFLLSNESATNQWIFFSPLFSLCFLFLFLFFSIVDSIINCVVFHSESRLFDSSASVSKPGDILCYSLFIFIEGINSVQGLKNVKSVRLLDYTRSCQLWRLY